MEGVLPTMIHDHAFHIITYVILYDYPIERTRPIRHPETRLAPLNLSHGNFHQ